MGVGFSLILLVMGGVREVLGAGTFLGYDVMGPRYEPWVIMVLPPGGFLTLGFVLLGIAWHRERKAAKVPPPPPVVAQPGPGGTSRREPARRPVEVG